MTNTNPFNRVYSQEDESSFKPMEPMTREAYYLMCMREKVYFVRKWVLTAFMTIAEFPMVNDMDPEEDLYGLCYNPAKPDVNHFAAKDQQGNLYPVEIIGSDIKKPLYNCFDHITINPGDIPLPFEEPQETSYGIILGNMYLLHYPFGNKFKFVNDIITDKLEKVIAEKLTDNVKPGETENPDLIYVRELVRYGEAAGALGGFDKLFASSGSLKVLTVDPKVIALRDELLKKHAHELNNPRVQAEIENAVVAADKASFKGDPAEYFLITGKAFNPTRKRQLIMIGGYSGFGGSDSGTPKFVPTSLREKWRVEDIPDHTNEARAGSFFRGKETASGGLQVKTGTRATMDVTLKQEYCGTWKGVTYNITKDNAKHFIGVNVAGKAEPIMLTSANIETYIGKDIMTHSPQYCKSQGDSYCSVCIGKTWTLLKDGLTNAVTNIGDVYMYDKMKRMHGKALVLATFNMRMHIS